MNKRTTNKVLAHIKATYPGADVFLTEDGIGWESGMDWTYDYCEKWSELEVKPVAGVYIDAISHWELGVYAA